MLVTWFNAQNSVILFAWAAGLLLLQRNRKTTVIPQV